MTRNKVYTVKVFKYYQFDAKDDADALYKIKSDSAFNEMIPDDESDALEVFFYHPETDEHTTLWKNSDKPTIEEFIDNEIKTFHEMRSKIQRPTNDKDIGFLRCLEYIKSNIEKGNIDILI